MGQRVGNDLEESRKGPSRRVSSLTVRSIPLPRLLESIDIFPVSTRNDDIIFKFYLNLFISNSLSVVSNVTAVND